MATLLRLNSSTSASLSRHLLPHHLITVITVYVFLYGRLYMVLSGVERAILENPNLQQSKALEQALATQSVVQLGLLLFTVICESIYKWSVSGLFCFAVFTLTILYSQSVDTSWKLDATNINPSIYPLLPLFKMLEIKPSQKQLVCWGGCKSLCQVDVLNDHLLPFSKQPKDS
ncbi:hypothetical protein Lal_00032248 [Lupinus albus]|nr:hypothetical protein Lal_00032248 [Lupinus albus]